MIYSSLESPHRDESNGDSSHQDESNGKLSHQDESNGKKSAFFITVITSNNGWLKSPQSRDIIIICLLLLNFVFIV
ncbi:hypothetical protein RIR_jg1941.t1 [Rhizophagus irregularis DAOM 181602=DAOM 197198]|nr:hypothetical protein RIR_jg1941.t1 [Rhizophagus irregularis DAOM 181602=DAOM 197198]